MKKITDEQKQLILKLHSLIFNASRETVPETTYGSLDNEGDMVIMTQQQLTDYVERCFKVALEML